MFIMLIMFIHSFTKLLWGWALYFLTYTFYSKNHAQLVGVCLLIAP